MKRIKNSKVVSVRIGQLELDLLDIKAKRLGGRNTTASLIRDAVKQFCLKD